MQKLVANSNRVLAYVVTPSTVTCAPVETNTPALRTRAGGSPALLNKIHLECTFAGAVPAGSFSGTASGDIVASTPRVQGEGQSLLVLGDEVKITCNGTATSGSTTSNATASVTVTVSVAGQTTVFANRP